MVPLPRPGLGRSRIAYETRDPRTAEEGRGVERRSVCLRSPIAEPAQAHEYQTRIFRSKQIGCQPVALLTANDQVRNKDICVCSEAANQRRSLRMPESDRKRTLAAVVLMKRVVDARRTLWQTGLTKAPTHRVPTERLHLDYVCAHIGHHGGCARSGYPVSDLYHLEAGKRGDGLSRHEPDISRVR